MTEEGAPAEIPADTIASIRRNAAHVLEDDLFARAPVMSRLLTYLVDRTIEGVPVKSYTIAIEALGKGEGELADADTYARVAVGRLRKTLTAYYAAHPGEDEIYIDTGSYAVRLRPAGDQAGKQAGAQAGGVAPAARTVAPDWLPHWLPYWFQGRLPGWIAGRGWKLACLYLALAALSAMAVAYFIDRDEEQWTQSNFPTLAVVRQDGAGSTDGAAEDLEYFHDRLRDRLLEHIGYRVIAAGDVAADYEIGMDMQRAGDAEVVAVTLMETATRRIIWTEQYRAADHAEIDRNAARVGAAIASPVGVLNGYALRRQIDPRTPYGCWLRFAETIKSYAARGDSQLYDCARDWYEADEGSRVAAFLRNWTLVDAANSRLGQSSRRADLEEALTVVHRALTRNPDNAMLYIAEMRTYSFLGKRREVRQAAASALASAPDNRMIRGLAGTWLAFWNDPQGGEILDNLDEGSGAPLYWEDVGKYVAAMMREDLPDTGRHLAQLRIYMEGQPALSVLDAAYSARMGRRRAADEALDRLRLPPRGLLVGPDEMLERLPFAPEVRACLQEWIAHPANPPARG